MEPPCRDDPGPGDFSHPLLQALRLHILCARRKAKAGKGAGEGRFIAGRKRPCACQNSDFPSFGRGPAGIFGDANHRYECARRSRRIAGRTVCWLRFGWLRARLVITQRRCLSD